LEGVDTIILIPHRDLYKLPLHSLFNLSFASISSQDVANYNIIYMPSLAMGLSLQSQSFSNGHKHHSNQDYPLLKSDKLASEIVSETFAISQDCLSY
jgi:hypothetical protein